MRARRSRTCSAGASSTSPRHLPARRAPRRPLLAAVLASALLAGCRVGPDYAAPDIATPDSWHRDIPAGELGDGQSLARWWELLADPVLDGLVERAVAGNLDVRRALARIDESRARYEVATGRHYPDVDARASGGRVRESENRPDAMPGFEARDASRWTAGLDAFWEIDLFGRVARGVESAAADVDAVVELERDVRVALCAEVAATYVAVRTTQERLRIARDNVKRQKDSLGLAQVRFDTGLSPKLDVAQARRILATTEAAIPGLEQDLQLALNRLAVLLGAHPGTLDDELAADAPIPVAPAQVVAGLPAELLRRRPDLRAAERALAAATARVGVAEADLYPQLGIAGSYGFVAEHADDLFDDPSRAFDVAGVLRWNLFDGGRVRGRIGASEAIVEQALAAYEQAVLRALEESEAALTSFVLERVRVAALERAVAAADETLSLSRDLYREGLTDFQNVLDAQEALLDAQDRLAQSRGRVTRNLIAVYKALGGGWDPSPDDTAAE